ncbi:MAG: sulfite exporter TauE/SafE family protein [Betaproteobacteria bacterium]|nr:MAG: sulfite exporter TauE/SafE family protein [Betaproteobacteria bacterium]
MAALAGLMGGVHCVGMCGGIVAATAMQGQRPSIRLLAGYNLGRIASYTAAGALAGLVGSAAFLAEDILPVQRILYVLAQVMLILVGLYLAGLNRSVVLIERAGARLWRTVQPWLGRVLPVQTPTQAVLAGALWGWLPCGLVYSVLISALASGSVASGALILLAFGLGTLPNLLAMGWAAGRMRQFFAHAQVRLVAGLSVAAFGVWGLLPLLR